MRRASVGVLFVSLFFALCGGGCTTVQTAMAPLHSSQSTTTAPVPPISWNSRGAGIDRTMFSFSTSTASSIVMYRFAIQDHQFRFEHATSAAVSEWARRIPEALFVSNGVYFHEDQLPSGWFKTRKQVIGMRSFDLDKSALITLQPNVDIFATPEAQKRGKVQSIEAAQSFPVLISHGKAALKSDSGKTSRRTFLGIDQSHAFAYIGIVPYTSISLYELSQALAGLPIQWETVLNLDGGPSSGIAFHDQANAELIDSYVTVPNVLVVTPKK